MSTTVIMHARRRLLARVAVLASLAACGAAGQEPQISFDPYKHVIWIPVRVNGGPVLNFAFDSAAAHSAIDWDRAEKLKLPFTSLGERYGGSGDTMARIGEAKDLSLTLPGASLQLPRLGVASLRGVSESYGRRMDGLVGAELFERYVVELDWEQQSFRFHDPRQFRYSGKGTAVPLIVAGGMPFLRVQISVPGVEPVEGIFLVDCPHPGTIIINRPFVEQHGLLGAARKNLPRLATQYTEGVNGRSEVLYGRIPELKIGPYVLRQPVVGFSKAKGGALAAENFHGILGAEILRRFKVFVDYAREQIILEPKSSMAGAFDYDASGVRLRSIGDDFREHTVIGVVEDSPAAKAGLQEGDRLLEIGGKPADSLSLGEILHMLKREGETVELKLQRGTQSVEAKLALRQLI